MNSRRIRTWAIALAAAAALALTGCGNGTSTSSGGSSDTGTTTDTGDTSTGEGTVASPVTLTLSTSHDGTVDANGHSYYVASGLSVATLVNITATTANVTISCFETSDYSGTPVDTTTGGAGIFCHDSSGPDTLYIEVDDADGAGSTYTILANNSG